MIKKHYYKDAFNTLKSTYLYNTSESKSTYIPTRVSSENGKSFRKKNRIFSDFVREITFISVSPKNCKHFAKKINVKIFQQTLI